MKKKTVDKTLEAVKAQGKKTETALKAASKDRKDSNKLARKLAQDQIRATNRSTQSMNGAMRAGFAEIASAINNQPQPLNEEAMARVMVAALSAHEQAKPQQKKSGIVGLIIAAAVIIIALLIAACWITAVMVGSKVNNQVTEVNQVRQEILAIQATAKAQSQSDRDDLIKAVGEVVNAKLAAQTQTVPDTVKDFMVKQTSELQRANGEQGNKIAALTNAIEGLVAIGKNNHEAIKGLEASLENEKRGNEQSKQFYDERIAAVVGLVKTAKAETPKQSDVQAPVTVTVNAPSQQEPVAQASAPASTTSSYSNDTKAKAPVTVENKKWSGNASVGFKSDNIERDGTFHPGSVIEANAQMFVTDRLSVNASVAQSSNVLSKKLDLGVGYELFPNLTVGLSGEKRDRDNRAILSIDFAKEVWTGKHSSLSVLADANLIKVFSLEEGANKQGKGFGYEAYLGGKYSLDYLSWSTLRFGAGVAYSSAHGQASRVNPFGRKFYYDQVDPSFAANLELSNEFRFGKHWTFTPSVTLVKTLNNPQFLGDVVTPGDLPKKTNVMFGIEAGYNW